MRTDAARRDDSESVDCYQLAIHFEIGPAEHAVTGNIGIYHRTDACVPHPIAELQRVGFGCLFPSVYGNFAVTRVDADGDRIAVTLCHPATESVVLVRNRTENYPPDPAGEIRLDPIFGANPAPDFAEHPTPRSRAADGVEIGKGSILCAVEIDQMQVLCTCPFEFRRLAKGIVVINGRTVVVALCQAYDFAAAYVDCGEQFHLTS